MKRKFKRRTPTRSRRQSVPAKKGDTIVLAHGGYYGKKAVVLECDRRKNYGWVSIKDLRGLSDWYKIDLRNKRELEVPMHHMKKMITRHNVFNHLLDN